MTVAALAPGASTECTRGQRLCGRPVQGSTVVNVAIHRQSVPVLLPETYR